MATTGGNRSDEIDLVELVKTLWASRVLILVITLIVTGAAAAYAFLSTPIYRTSVQLLPPTTSSLVAYNAARQAILGEGPGLGGSVAPGQRVRNITPEEVYSVFLRHLDSNSLKESFVEQTYLPALRGVDSSIGAEQVRKSLDNTLTVKLPKNWSMPATIAPAGGYDAAFGIRFPQLSDDQHAVVTVSGEDPTEIVEYAHAYVEAAQAAATNELLGYLATERAIRQERIEKEISAARAVANQQRLERIRALEQALVVAQGMSIATLADGAALRSQHASRGHTDNPADLPPYLLGEAAIRAEIQHLQLRGNDDAYVAELPALMRGNSALSDVPLETAGFSAATIDLPAAVPMQPAEPRTLLIIALGCVLGAMLGVLAAALRAAWSTIKGPSFRTAQPARNGEGDREAVYA